MAKTGLIIGTLAPLVLSACTPAAPATEVVEVVAVTSHGQPQDGYREQPSDSNVTTVSGCAASPAAVSPGVYQCWPSAAAADVCWRAGSQSLLCVDDPWDKRLHRVKVDGELPQVQPSAGPQPFALLLDDGTRCRLRSGGAWGGRDDGYLGVYGCQSTALTVLARQGQNAVDHDAPRWTVKVGELGAAAPHFPPPQTRTVTTAWFAAQAS